MRTTHRVSSKEITRQIHDPDTIIISDGPDCVMGQSHQSAHIFMSEMRPYRLDQHPSYDKIKAHTVLCFEKDVNLIAINQP